jgi:outer membrane protein TolC
MKTTALFSLTLLLGFAALPAGGAEPLTLKQAIATALEKNPAVRAASAAEAQAAARLIEARSNYFPKVNYSEQFQRGNNPVYVFGTLLTQNRFTAANFALDALNHPDAVNNFQSQLTLDQVIYDGRQTALGSKIAGFGQQVVREQSRYTDMDTIQAVVRFYYGAVLAAENVRVAQEAMKTAEANLRRAENLRDTGMVTDADVLSLRVHLAGVKEQQIRAANDLEVAKAALDDAIGVPLDTDYQLTSALTPAGLPGEPLERYEREALERRPEARQAFLAGQMATTQSEMARAAFLPQMVAHAGFEADRQRFTGGGGTNWVAAVSVRFNILNGFADKARLEESAAAERRADAERERAQSGIRLDVRRSYLDLRAADQRVEVARAAIAEAAESLRIIQNRYEAGLTNVTDLLRSDTALLAARTRHLAAVYDQRMAAVRLEQAVGRLSADSEVLN